MATRKTSAKAEPKEGVAKAPAAEKKAKDVVVLDSNGVAFRTYPAKEVEAAQEFADKIGGRLER